MTVFEVFCLGIFIGALGSLFFILIGVWQYDKYYYDRNELSDNNYVVGNCSSLDRSDKGDK